MVASRHHLAALPAVDDVWDAPSRSWKTERQQLALQQLELVGSSILVGAGYHRGGIDQTSLRQLHSATRGGSLPFVYAADFNCSPDVFRASGWPQLLKCTVWETPTPTCWSSADGSKLDFFLISDAILHLVLDVKTVLHVPFGPHSAIMLILSRAARAHRVWMPRLPRELPRFCGPIAEAFSWDECKTAAFASVDPALLISDPGLAGAWKVTDGIGTSAEAFEQGVGIWRWTQAAERWTLGARGTPPADPSAYLGRAGPPQFGWVAVTPKRHGPCGIRVPLGLSLATRAAAAIAVAAKRVREGKSAFVGILLEMALASDPAVSCLLARLGTVPATKLQRALVEAAAAPGEDTFLAQWAEALVRKLSAEDKLADEVRWQKCVAEMLQNGGGGRSCLLQPPGARRAGPSHAAGGPGSHGSFGMDDAMALR